MKTKCGDKLRGQAQAALVQGRCDWTRLPASSFPPWNLAAQSGAGGKGSRLHRTGDPPRNGYRGSDPAPLDHALEPKFIESSSEGIKIISLLS